MNYEIAKQLKDAGFPQAGSGRWLIEGYKVAQVRVSAFPEPKGIRAYEPTLEELIEACGRPFWLEINVGFEGDVWLAGKNIGPPPPHHPSEILAPWKLGVIGGLRL